MSSIVDPAFWSFLASLASLAVVVASCAVVVCLMLAASFFGTWRDLTLDQTRATRELVTATAAGLRAHREAMLAASDAERARMGKVSSAVRELRLALEPHLKKLAEAVAALNLDRPITEDESRAVADDIVRAAIVREAVRGEEPDGPMTRSELGRTATIAPPKAPPGAWRAAIDPETNDAGA